MKETIRILSTKKLSPSIVLDAKLHGIEIDEKEFISIHPIKTTQKKKEADKWLNADKNYLAFTSSNAANALADLLGADHRFPETGWNIFGLSGKTKQALERIFPQDVIITAESATELAETIGTYHPKEVVFFCGDRRRDELPDVLTDRNITVHEVILYETKEEPVRIYHQYDGVLFFSPSAASSFFSVNFLPVTTVCFAIGKTTGDFVTTFTTNDVVISNKPTQVSLLETVKNHFTNTKDRNAKK